MASDWFQALVLERQEDGATKATLKELSPDTLPDGDVDIAVAYSSLNYKDGLAVTGEGRIIRSFPFVPGIDLAGTVLRSESPDYRPGDRVILTGWGIGERHWGGFAQRARVRSEWLVPLPAGLDLRGAMALGTAGFTAMLAVMALEQYGLAPDEREVVVTGAAGGLGSIAVALLAAGGHNVVASSGRAEAHAYLSDLGARQIIDRGVLSAPSKRPMESERWAGAVDTVGGETLAGLLRSMSYQSAIAVCGLAGGHELHTTVYPLILRGVSLLGIDSVMCPQERRRAAWARLAQQMPGHLMDSISQVVPLREVPALSRAILAGQVRGRIVVDVNA
ncbi:MAG TPA: MDR family oxidoreductase [Chloroflexota bacterium]|nr:MDR family oxidoreductase [Chloroflexota bacterium]